MNKRYQVQVFAKNGTMLVHTWNIGEHSRDMEIEAALSREKVGRVVWWSDFEKPQTVWKRDTRIQGKGDEMSPTTPTD